MFQEELKHLEKAESSIKEESFQLVAPPPELPPLDYSLATMFRCLDADNVIKVRARRRHAATAVIAAMSP